MGWIFRCERAYRRPGTGKRWPGDDPQSVRAGLACLSVHVPINSVHLTAVSLYVEVRPFNAAPRLVHAIDYCLGAVRMYCSTRDEAHCRNLVRPPSANETPDLPSYLANNKKYFDDYLQNL